MVSRKVFTAAVVWWCALFALCIIVFEKNGWTLLPVSMDMALVISSASAMLTAPRFLPAGRTDSTATHSVVWPAVASVPLARGSIPKDVSEPSNWRASRAEVCAGRLPNPPGWPEILPPVTVVHGAMFLGVVSEEQVQLAYAQIDSLFEVGLLTADNVEVHFVLSHGSKLLGQEASNSGPVVSSNAIRVFDKVTERIRQQTLRAQIVYRSRNASEFDGLHYVWSLARRFPDRYYLYFHNEGATHPKYPSTRRTSLEMALFREVIAPWRAVLQIFEHFQANIQHLSMSPAVTRKVAGFHWFNFWWARGTYLARNIEPPLGPGHGHGLWEQWLGKASTRLESNGTDPHDRFFSGKTACGVTYSLKACNFGHCTRRDQAMLRLAAYERALVARLGTPVDVLEPSNWAEAQAVRCAGGLSQTRKRDSLGVTIVYSATFLGSVHEEQTQLVYAQLDSLFQVGLLTDEQVEVHIVLSHGDKLLDQEANGGVFVSSNATDVFNKVTQRIQRYTSSAKITYHHQHHFDFFGLHHLWSLSKEKPGQCYLYFHNKGATHVKFPGTTRMAMEMALFREIVAPWRAVLHIFRKNRNVRHLSMTPAFGGFHWFNFWWARGGFLATRVEPLAGVQRRDYQCWIGQAAGKDSAQCWGGGARTTDRCDASAYALANCSAGICFDEVSSTRILNEYEVKLMTIINGDLG